MFFKFQNLQKFNYPIELQTGMKNAFKTIRN
jgi:hypothetical protein